MEKPVILAHSKGHLDVSQWLSRNQLIEYDYKDDYKYNICVRSTHMDSLSSMLHSMWHMNHNTTPASASYQQIPDVT